LQPLHLSSLNIALAMINLTILYKFSQSYQ